VHLHARRQAGGKRSWRTLLGWCSVGGMVRLTGIPFPAL
jgi:hypothetical protein